MQSVEARTVGSSTFHFRASLSSLRARSGRDTLTRAGARTRDRNHMVPTCWPERPYTDRTAPHVAVLQHFEVSCWVRGGVGREMAISMPLGLARWTTLHPPSVRGGHLSRPFR